MKKLLKDERVINFGEELIEVKDRFIGKSFDITLVPALEELIGEDFKAVELTDIEFKEAKVVNMLTKAVIKPYYLLSFGDKVLHSSYIVDIKPHLSEEEEHYKELAESCPKKFYINDDNEGQELIETFKLGVEKLGYSNFKQVLITAGVKTLENSHLMNKKVLVTLKTDECFADRVVRIEPFNIRILEGDDFTFTNYIEFESGLKIDENDIESYVILN